MPKELTIFRAASEGSLDRLEELVSTQKQTPNQKDIDGLTPLYHASQRNKILAVKYLLHKGAEVNQVMDNTVPDTALGVAAQNGFLKVVTELLSHGAKTNNLTTSGSKGAFSPLWFASKFGHRNVVSLLVTHGAEVNQSTSSGTPLYVASKHGHVDVALCLLEKGASVDCGKSNGATPLFAAARMGHKEVVECLLKHGADTSATMEDKSTPLHTAVWANQAKVVSLLLDHNVQNINAKMKDGSTPLYIASMEGNAKCVELLLKGGAKTEAKISPVGSTPLIVATENNHPEVVKLLLAAKANVNGKTQEGNTALHYAAETANVEITKELTKKGAKVVKNKNNHTALDIAQLRCYKGNSDWRKRSETIIEHLDKYINPTLEDIEWPPFPNRGKKIKKYT